MLSSPTCFSEKQCYKPDILLRNARSVSECLFVLVCAKPRAASLSNSISTSQVASWRKTPRIAAMETSKQTGSENHKFIKSFHSAAIFETYPLGHPSAAPIFLNGQTSNSPKMFAKLSIKFNICNHE